MDSAVEKKRLEKLARVRENQRKSRARRQDHLHDLEQKVLGLQKELDRRDVENRLAVQKLEAENKKLRDLLSASGVPSDALNAYLQRMDNPVMAQKVAIPALQRSNMKTASSCAQKLTSESCTSDIPEDKNTTIETTTNIATEVRPGKAEKTPAPEIESFCGCSPEEGLESLPISERVLNTTFCGIAEQLVEQYNTRGVDISEIREKLREGFFRGLAEEGCRVQNQILFQVLDEISGQ
ncbi:hypothetical protein BJX68DRAFT_99532 [Aspergillus pseudodeflectus]|uniref:BZIP domain-containing protein n=1 Tax=Aspergillus pseudodeflectus TaxID=176178 RepID=A0ABR4K8J2_9EURO